MPEQADGWAGALTLPRELTLKNQQLVMQPVREVAALRTKTLMDQQAAVNGVATFGKDLKQAEFKASLDLTATQRLKSTISLMNASQQAVVSLSFDQATGDLVLQRADRPDARYAVTATDNDTLDLDIFIDTSSLEIFVNGGTVVFTERFYDDTAKSLQLQTDQAVTVTAKLFELNSQANRY